MKRFKALILVGGILLFIGISVLFAGLGLSREFETVTIPAGGDWFGYLQFDFAGGGQLTGTWGASPSGTTVDMYVLNQAGYDEYSYDLETSNGVISEWHGESGSLSTTLPTSGRYYLVMDHGTGYENVEQKVSFRFRALGVDPTWVSIAVLLLAFGSLLLALGWREKRREAPSAPVAPTAGVRLFDEPAEDAKVPGPPAEPHKETVLRGAAEPPGSVESGQEGR